MISSRFGYFYGAKGQYSYEGCIIDRHPDFVAVIPTGTIKTVQSLGKPATIFLPPSLADFDVGECLGHQYTGPIILGRNDCQIDFNLHQTILSPATQLLQSVQEQTRVAAVWPPELRCNGATCRTELDLVPSCRDQGPLHIKGAKILIDPPRIF